jgi:hypothetical protein
MAQVKLTKTELASREIAKLEEANVIINYAIAEIEKDLERIYEKQKSEFVLFGNTIKGYFKCEFEITNRMEFAYGNLYIYCLESNFNSLTLRLDVDNKLSINWFSTTCNSENHAMLNYLSILGTIAGNINKIETEFKIWIEEYNLIESLTKEKNKLHRNAKMQISSNLNQIERLQKKNK